VGLPFLIMGSLRQIKASKINGQIDQKKKKKKQLYREKIGLLDFAKVKARKEKEY
jgi:hypothetical protein